MIKGRHRAAVRLLLLYIPFIFIAYLLQATVFSELPIGGAKPLILPVAVLGVAMFGGRIRGGVFGLFAGILCDVALCQPTILFTLLLTFAGITVGALFDTVLSRGFPAYFLICFFMLILSSFCQMFSLLFYYDAPLIELLITALYQTVYSIVFAFPSYWAARFIGRSTRG